jgi:MraZ protein
MFSGYIGTYNQTMDEKNRVVVPAKFRALFETGIEAASFYVTRGPERCLMMFTPEQWQRWEGAVTAATEAKEMAGSVRHFSRLVYANGTLCTCDKLGRVTLPPTLVEYAGLGKDVVILGVKNRMEIWSAQRWNEYQARVLEDFENLTEEIYKESKKSN